MARMTHRDRLASLERRVSPATDSPKIADLPHGQILTRLAAQIVELDGGTDARSRALAALYADQAHALLPGDVALSFEELTALVGHVGCFCATLGVPDDEDWLAAVGRAPAHGPATRGSVTNGTDDVPAVQRRAPVPDPMPHPREFGL